MARTLGLERETCDLTHVRINRSGFSMEDSVWRERLRFCLVGGKASKTKACWQEVYLTCDSMEKSEGEESGNGKGGEEGRRMQQRVGHQPRPVGFGFGRVLGERHLRTLRSDNARGQHHPTAFLALLVKCGLAALTTTHCWVARVCCRVGFCQHPCASGPEKSQHRKQEVYSTMYIM